MSMQENTRRILAVLSDNLREAEPQLVLSETIAGRLNMPMPELQQILKSMDGNGIIETDPDLQRNLITRKGLLWLQRQN